MALMERDGINGKGWHQWKWLIVLPGTNLMETALLLSFLTTGDVRAYLRFLFLIIYQQDAHSDS